jgi:hypothetical protein
MRISTVLSIALLFGTCAVPCSATDWHVAPGGTGAGTVAAPFARLQEALNVAQPGDHVVVAPGTYAEVVTTVRAGTAQSPITLRARDARGSAIVTAAGRVLTVNHAYVTVQALVLDGQFGADDVVRVSGGATGLTLRNVEVRSTSRDGIDIGATQDVLIEGSLIHHTLNAAGGRTDAHGIVAGAARRLTIRDTEVHTFSGDAFQIDPGRALPGWGDVLIEGCRFWLRPLPAPVNGFAAGVVPGENAVDTKVGSGLPRPSLIIRNSEFFGFGGGLITNMAALNLKENVDAVVDRVTIHGSEIAFRLRGPANVRVQNAVVHSTSVAVRYEDNIQGLRIWNSTFGNGVGRAFVPAAASASVLDVRNLLILAATLPAEASGASNLAVSSSAFVNAAGHDYQLTASSPAVDRGVPIAEVAADRAGIARPVGAAYDVGAYERTAGTRPSPPTNLRIVR